VSTVYDILQEEYRIAWGGIFNNPESKTVLLEQHKKIVSAIKMNNPQEARRSAREHLDYAEKKWAEALLQKT
jgi:DNA-binding FadR family transcriptional regulator